MDKKDVLIVDPGGRGHTLGWKIRQSPRCGRLFAAPGNPGLAQIAECVPIQADDVDGLLDFALKHQIGLTVVGPEKPLADGICDRFRGYGLKIFGPSQRAALIEADKSFAMRLMNECGVPTGWHELLHSPEEVLDFAEAKGVWTSHPLVIKNPYLAGGKGANICRKEMDVSHAVAEIIQQQTGRMTHDFLAMEYLPGIEVSITAITDGTNVVYLAPAQDHKYRNYGNTGPMTGGMGTIAPAPYVTPELQEEIHNRIILPTIHGLAASGRPYTGVLYAGLMLTTTGPKVLEFNCRFGDSEAQVILPILEADLLEIMLAACAGRLHEVKIPPPAMSAACVVAASAGYPSTSQVGKVITGLSGLDSKNGVLVFHAGTQEEGNILATAGGRVLGITGLGYNLPLAVQRAYHAMGFFNFEGRQFRTDIGAEALEYLRRQVAP